MSSIVINIPDCAVETGKNSGDQITISTTSCPNPPPGPPPVISWWETLVIGIVLLAAVGGFAIVRYRAHELKPDRLAQKNIARKQELDAQIELAKAHRQCVTCGQKYEPELK